MKISYVFSCIAVMAVVTYLIRAVPMVVFRKKMENIWIRSFLFYVPYVVLSAMTFPAVFYSTGSVVSAVCGCIAGILLALWGKGLLTVASVAALVSFFVQIAGV